MAPKLALLKLVEVRDRDHTVATESRRIEIRMIDDVEKLTTELHSEALVNRYVLERREVEPVITWAGSRSRTESEDTEASFGYASSRSWRGVTQFAGLLESVGIV